MMWPQMSREELCVTRLAKLTRGGRCAGLPDNSRTLKFYQIRDFARVLFHPEKSVTFGL